MDTNSIAASFDRASKPGTSAAVHPHNTLPAVESEAIPVFPFRHIQHLKLVTDTQITISSSSTQAEWRSLGGVRGMLELASPGLTLSLMSLTLVASPSAALNLLQSPCWAALRDVTLHFPAPSSKTSGKKASKDTTNVLSQLTTLPFLHSLALHHAATSISCLLLQLPQLKRLALHDHDWDNRLAAADVLAQQTLQLEELLITAQLAEVEARLELPLLAATVRSLTLGPMVDPPFSFRHFSSLTRLHIGTRNDWLRQIPTTQLAQHLRAVCPSLSHLQLTDRAVDAELLTCIAGRFTGLQHLHIGLLQQEMPGGFSMRSLHTLHCSLRCIRLPPLPRMFPCLVSLRIHGGAGRRGPAPKSIDPSAWAPGSLASLTSLDTTHDVLALSGVVDACSAVTDLSTTMKAEMWPSSRVQHQPLPPHLLFPPMTGLQTLTLTCITGGSTSVSEAPYYGAPRGDAQASKDQTSDEVEEVGSLSSSDGEACPLDICAAPPESPQHSKVGSGSSAITAATTPPLSRVTRLAVRWYVGPKLACVAGVAAAMPLLEAVCLQHWQTRAVVGGDASLLHSLVAPTRMRVLCLVGCPGVTRRVCGDVEREAGRPGLRVECWAVRPGKGSHWSQALDERSAYGHTWRT
ncbi:MAG: hypothetical protein WDW38_005547 [Sanguina aurantia]